MTSELHVDLTSTAGGAAVAAVRGELDVNTAPTLYHDATALLGRHPILVLDLGEVGFCDSSGFNALLRLHRRARELRGEVVLAAPPSPITRLLALTGADSALPLYDTLPAALAALGAPEKGDEPPD